MTLRLSRGEFWLLANAVDHGLSLRMRTMPQTSWHPTLGHPRRSPTRAMVRIAL